jgi:hypothetical protein
VSTAFASLFLQSVEYGFSGSGPAKNGRRRKYGFSGSGPVKNGRRFFVGWGSGLGK